ncbi:MAG TPA: (5-formylfuran-3-yl)methyl phosphate synthase [Alphaproteobacteria bacterium]|nr:(5-formylfuran-3-yl)methyl phosphate synthase [Alphaproteobacteria bacterium]
MTALLASVRNRDEALIALEGGADILDLKEPGAGALGRLPERIIGEILKAVDRRCVVSATIGDMPLDPTLVASAVDEMAKSGVDIVKIGIFDGALESTLLALASIAASGRQLVAVLFADRAPELTLVDRFAAAGFRGVMLDTADKGAGPLTRHLPLQGLAEFVARARGCRLFTGLAGSLGVDDVPHLVPLGPDYLGFRTALTSGRRDGPIDRDAVVRVRAAIEAASRRVQSTAVVQASASNSATAAEGAQSAAASATAGSAGMSAATLR